MKITHIVTGSMSGGAALGVLNLHLQLLSKGIDSVVVGDFSRSSSYPRLVSIAPGFISQFALKIRRKVDKVPCILYPRRKKRIFTSAKIGSGFFFSFINNFDQIKKADIVHIHTVDGGLISLREVSKIERPIVWTLRDMWLVAGGCHYAMDCKNFLSSCGNCPQLGSNWDDDLSRRNVLEKRKRLQKNIHVVGISKWLTDLAKSAPALGGVSSFSTISNGIDLAVYYPEDKKRARKKFQLSPDVPIVLLGAQNLGDFYKGFSEALEAIKLVASRRDFLLLVFGEAHSEDLKKIACKTMYLGFVTSPDVLRLAYSAADVFLAPSKMEAFGKTVVEAMACGTPVVAFDATGPRDIISHKLDGFLAQPFEAQGLAEGIEWVLGRSEPDSLQRLARRKVEEKFTSGISAEKYIDLYWKLKSGQSNEIRH